MFERCGRVKREQEGLARGQAERVSKDGERSERSSENESCPASTLAVSGGRSKSRGGELEPDDVRPACGALLFAQPLQMRHYLRIQPRGCGGRAIPTGGWRSPLAITPLPGCGGAEDQAARRAASPRGAGPASFSLSDDTRPTPDALLPRFDVFPCDRLVAQAFVLPFLVRCHLHIQRRCGHGPRTRRSWNPT